MKKILLLTFLLIHTAFAQTNVSGFINANTNWNLAGSPYIVIGNALVSQGYTLTIDPGVVVEFELQKALQIDGELIAIGTPANHITFTSAQVSPTPGDWAKLHFSSYCVPATYDTLGNYASGTIMKYCDVLYGGDLDYGEVHIESAMPYMSHCNIKYSYHDGIYCAGSTFILDSSYIGPNGNYGLYFNNFSQNSCGLVINGDSINDNAWGGLFLGYSSGFCTTEIKNCYFISNSTHGAINDSANFLNVNIHNNTFLNNSSFNNYWNSGIVTFSTNSYVNYRYINVDDNYFNNNNSYNHCVYIVGSYNTSGYNVNIRRNYFNNNSSSSQGVIGFYEPIHTDTISCNYFINNHTHAAVIEFETNNSYNLYSCGVIQHNIFDGNNNLANNGTGILEVTNEASTDALVFSNNVIRNNSTVNGRLCHISAYLNDSTELLKIYRNEFRNNTSAKVIFLTGPLINNSSLDFMYFKHNNFLDSAYEFTLYDSIPYGSPNIKADSNYWGSTSTQHVDSIIYDYFDYAAQSVVYYMPISQELNSVDTVCRVPCFIGASSHANIACHGDSSGFIILASAGTPQFSYSWSPSGGNGPTATNLVVGIYTCVMTDSAGCTTSTTVNLTQPFFPTIIQMQVLSNASCATCPNGSARVNPDYNYSPYTYSWSTLPVQTTNIATSLAPGTYTCCVTDVNGCTICDTVTISYPLSVNESNLINLFTIQPNPFSNEIIITDSGSHRNKKQVSLFDITGKEILRREFSEAEIRLNTEELAGGFYLLRVEGENFKVVKN